MDIRRLPLWEGRTASVLTNSLVHAVIEDQAGMVLEFSADNRIGGRLNAHSIPWFRGRGMSVYNDDNHMFWQDEQLLYHRAGAYFSFPNVGAACTVGDVRHPCDGATAHNYWMVERYGTDPVYGGVWLLSSQQSREAGNSWVVRKVDVLLPNHPVLYTGYSITNTGTDALRAENAYQSLLGFPFLETGCIFNSAASHWYVSSRESRVPPVKKRLLGGALFGNLKQAPTPEGGTVDASIFPGLTGTEDFVSGIVPRDIPVTWASAINPRQQMAYLMFAPGPQRASDSLITADYTHFGFLYGGSHATPQALYDGGSSFSAQVLCGMGTYYQDEGLAQALQQENSDGIATTIGIEPGQTRTFMAGIALTAYDNPRMSGGFYSVEALEDSFVMKRTKSTIVIPANPSFAALSAIMERVL